MAKLYDMAKMTVSSASAPYAGTITLGVAAPADGITYQTFAAAGAQDQDVLSYRISDGVNWEVGRGIYTATGTQLTRGMLTSSTGSLLSVSASALVSIVALAEDFVDSVASGLLAAGTTQATGTQLRSQFNVVITVPTGAGVVLPPGSGGLRCLVRNSDVNSLLVYPMSGAAINAQALNTAITVAANTTGYFEAQSLTQWFSVP